MAAPAHRITSWGDWATSTSIPTSFGAGWAADDYAVLFVGLMSTSPTVTTPSGWTLLAAKQNCAGADASCYFFGRKLVGGDTAPTVELSVSHNGYWGIQIYSGVDTASPTEGAATAAPASGTDAPIDVTTSGVERTVVVFAVADAPTTHTATPPTGATERWDAPLGLATGHATGADKEEATAATRTYTFVMSGAYTYALAGVALKPGEAGPEVPPPWVPVRSSSPGLQGPGRERVSAQRFS